VTSEVEAVVPEQLWTRVQEMLVRRRKDRLAPQRYAGGYVLTELLRCACGSPMVGTSNRSYRYYRCMTPFPVYAGTTAGAATGEHPPRSVSPRRFSSQADWRAWLRDVR
jgi:hypothetical protein